MLETGPSKNKTHMNRSPPRLNERYVLKWWDTCRLLKT
ncbi:unnamed protein product [Brassica oleracea var. botrytis]